MVKDPVCGMDIDSEDAYDEVEFGGETYYFCCSECLTQFELDPQKFVGDSMIA